MNFATKYYELNENPVMKAGSIGISNAEEMQFWTLDEYLLFAEAIMEEPLYYYCFEVLYWTGIREAKPYIHKYFWGPLPKHSEPNGFGTLHLFNAGHYCCFVKIQTSDPSRVNDSRGNVCQLCVSPNILCPLT